MSIRQERKPGRPRAIPEDSIPRVLSLYEAGFGYRAITRELEREGILVVFSTVRRVIKAQEMPREAPDQP